MAEGAFVSADIKKLDEFERQSGEVIKEFGNIKDTYVELNSTLLGDWKGKGADKYKYKTDHVLEKITELADILDSINTGAVNDIRTTYNALDDELGTYNANPSAAEE